MLTCLIVAIGMTGQTSRDRDFVGPPDLRTIAEIMRPAPVKTSPTLTKRQAKRAALARYANARYAEEQAERAAQMRAYQAEQARLERLYPLMLQARRDEMMRQYLAAQAAAATRNAASLERMSGFRTPWNSSIPPQTPQAPPHLQGSPLDPQ